MNGEKKIQIKALQTKSIPYKQWRVETGRRLGISEQAVWQRVQVGRFPGLKLRFHNAREILVIAEPTRSEPMTIKEWAASKAAELGISRHAVEQRLSRGTLPYPAHRRLNARVVLVEQETA